MESFYKSFKREVLNKYGFKNKSEAVVQLVDYLENYYNVKKIHSNLGYKNTRRISNFTKLTYLFVHKSLAIPVYFGITIPVFNLPI